MPFRRGRKMPHIITITSPTTSQTLNYPLAVIKGETTYPDANTISISTSSSNSQNTFESIVSDGRFHAVCLLQPGNNTFSLFHRNQSAVKAETSLEYTPFPDNFPCIRLIYLKTSDSDGSFQAPNGQDNSEETGKRRLYTAGLIIQAATAELMAVAGFERQTFRLYPTVLTHTLSDLTMSEAHTKDGHELFHIIHKSLSDNEDNENVINLVVMSFTRYIDGKALAHTALGGGRLALFGGANLFCWPDDTSDIARAFSDHTKIDKSCLFDDSAFRGTWATCAATTIGAMLHEVGHCWSLPHPFRKGADQRAGIMGRGFDYIHRIFVSIEDKAHNESKHPMPHWDRGSAVRLHFHRFLQLPDDVIANMKSLNVHQASSNYPSSNSYSLPSPTPVPIPRSSAVSKHQGRGQDMAIRTQEDWKHSEELVFRKCTTTDGNGDAVKCLSKYGLGHIGYYCNGDNAAHEEFLSSHPLSFELPSLKELIRRCKANEKDKFVVSAIDVMHNIKQVAYPDIFK